MPRSSQHIEASSRLKSQMKENHWVKNTQVLHAGVMYHCKGDEVCLFWIKTLGWLLMVQSHWDVNRKGKLAWFYVHQRGFLCHGLSLLEPSSIFQMSQVLPFHVGDHVWCDASWNIWDTGVLVCRWGRVIWSSVLDTWFQSLWNYYCMGMLFPMIKRQFPFSPIHRVFWEKKENDEP